MPDIGNIGYSSGLGNVGPVSRPTDPTTRAGTAAPAEAPRRTEARDSVELSDHARWLDALRSSGSSTPTDRSARIEAIRAQIAAGTYETDEKLNVAINRLLEDVQA